MRKIAIKNLKLSLLSIALLGLLSCNTKPKSSEKMESLKKGTYGYDIEFLNKHTKPIELKNGDARIIISPEYQGRVMTSTAGGNEGLSYGWINHDLIASGEVLKQINPVGGEERFWMGPEGGQYSIFFKNGSSFDFAEWATPACIDTEAFELRNSNKTVAEFSKSIEISNYSNFQFKFDVSRKVSLLDDNMIINTLDIDFVEKVKAVAYETVNQLKNTGEVDWSKESGLLSIWMLGMFNPSDEVTVFIPYKTEAESDYIVKDDYFGEIPSDRLVVKEGVIFFKGNGMYQWLKLGLSCRFRSFIS